MASTPSQLRPAARSLLEPFCTIASNLASHPASLSVGFAWSAGLTRLTLESKLE